MKKSIEFITALLQTEAEVYKRRYAEIMQEKDDSMKQLKSTFIANTPAYKQKFDNILLNYEKSLADARHNATKNVIPVISEFRDELLSDAKRVDENKINKITSLMNIPMSMTEIQALADKYDVSHDYWSGRIFSMIAESNGIPASAIGVSPTLDTKLSVVAQLERQFEQIVEHFGADDRDTKMKTSYLYLNDSVLSNAKSIFNGTDNSESDVITRSLMLIHAQQNDIQKGVAIQNALKNLKGMERNEMLCQLKMDKGITDYALQFANVNDEVVNFDAEAFIHSQKQIDKIQAMNDEDAIKEIIATMQENENPFFDEMLEIQSKKNEGLKQLLVDVSKTDNNSHSQTTENVVELKY